VKYALLLPAIVSATIFMIMPIVQLFRLALVRTNFIVTQWAGLANFVELVKNPVFLRSAINSLFYIVILVGLEIGVFLFLALTVYEMSKKWQNAARIVFYLPMISTGIFISQVWRWIYHIDGPLNWIIGFFGIEPISWVAQGVTAIPAVSVSIAMSAGGIFIVFLAAISSIDKSYFEAAKIDGASNLQIKKNIVIPMIRRHIILMALVVAISAPQIFETIFVLAPYEHAATVGFVIYREAFQLMRFGSSAAMGVVLMIAMMGLVVLRERIQKHMDLV
jgi:multiple sugar transport system permease protein